MFPALSDNTKSLLLRMSPFALLGTILIGSGVSPDYGVALIGLTVFPFIFVRLITLDVGGRHPL